MTPTFISRKFRTPVWPKATIQPAARTAFEINSGRIIAIRRMVLRLPLCFEIQFASGRLSITQTAVTEAAEISTNERLSKINQGSEFGAVAQENSG
ncbi:hypothetical protein Brsp01_07430 [Brucella sp. NBRC 12950]|nr:hypothetical protein Brsp01_07430 [Brucella sp. NBRC 12950]